MQLTSDQIELGDVVRRFLQDAVPSEYLRKRITSGLRRDEALIVSLKALGLEEGFSGAAPTLSFRDLALISEEVGRALVPEPIVERLFLDCFLPHLLSDQGRQLFSALGGSDATSAYAPAACCKLGFNRKTKTVSGEIAWAWGTEGARRLIATVDDGKQKHLVALSLDQVGVARSSVTSLDITIALSSFSLKGASVVVFSENESRLIEECMEALKASEVAGIAARAVEMTTEYVKTREQFGVPIGAFQAIQHRLADAYASSEALAFFVSLYCLVRCQLSSATVINGEGCRIVCSRCGASYM